VGVSQVHDFNPGIRPSGLFWTQAIAADQIAADSDSGWARMHAAHMPMTDYHDFANSVSPSPTKRPGHVTFDVRWTGNESARKTVRNEQFGFAGTYVPATAGIEFLVRDDDSAVVYRSVDHGQTTVSGGIGHERNGRFFT
jgi:hypothetical protein